MKMNNEELNTALYQKMEREQDKYRKWLIQWSARGNSFPCL